MIKLNMILCDICLKLKTKLYIRNLRKDKVAKYGGKRLKIIRNILKIIVLTIFILSPLLFVQNIHTSYGSTNDLIVQGKNNAETIWLTLRQIYGYTDIATAAIMGNLQYESGLRSNNAENLYVGNNSSGTEDKDIAYTNMMNNNRAAFCDKDVAWSGQTNGSLSIGGRARDGYVGYGLAQWTYWNRKALLWDMAHEAGVSIDNIGIQLKVLDYELKNSYKSVRDTMQNTTDLTVATSAFLKGYERPADQSDSVVQKRTGGAISYYNTYSGKIYSDNSVTIEVNCNEMAVVNKDNVSLYNEPKTSGNVVTTMQNGQVITRINNSGKYVSDGKIFDGVLLANGKKGFVLRENLNTTDFSKVYRVKTSSGVGVNVRASKSTSSSRVTGIDEGGLVTVLEKGTKLENGYYWDYITAPDGVKGYVADNLLKKLIEDVPNEPEPEVPDTPTPPATTSEAFKIDSTKNEIKMIPSADYNTFKKVYSDVVITKPDGTNVTEGLIGTGYKITTGGKTYTAIKLGDTTGDGIINSADLLKIQKHLLKVISLDNTPNAIASDTNDDGNINSADLLKIQKKLLGVTEITL